MSKFHYTATSSKGRTVTRTSARQYTVAIFATDHLGAHCFIGFSRDEATAAKGVHKYWKDVEIVPAALVEKSKAKEA